MPKDNRTRDVSDDAINKILDEPEPEEDKDTPEPETPTPQPEDKKDTPEKDKPVDKDQDYYKDKFSYSSRENQVIKADNDRVYNAFEEADKLEVSEDELRIKAKEWGKEYDELDEFSKQVLKDAILNGKKINKFTEVAKQTKETNQWLDAIDTFIEDDANLQKYPVLAGRENDFKRFCLKDKNRNLELDLLVKAFSFDVPSTQKKKGSLLMDAKGAGTPAKTKQLTADDAKRIRTSDPREYEKLVRSGAFAHLADEL